MTAKTRIILSSLVCSLLLSRPGSSEAQIQPPSGPVTFCVTQAPPQPDSYQVSVDAGAYAPVSMAATMDARCPASATHSFTLEAAPFTIGSHTVRLQAVNQFGSTEGPVYTVVVGIAPGQPTIVAVIPPAE